MILDSLDQASRYLSSHPGFSAAFDYLRGTDLTSLAAGKHEIDGERLFLMLNRGEGKGHAGTKLEAHRRYLDIQLTLEGTDEIGWRGISTCQDVAVPFDSQKDFGLWNDAPQLWVQIPPGCFAIFYPEDAHAPMGSTCPLVKAVMKVAVEW